ncbi:MAG: polyprenyl synthetase family protein [Patescibacteria group bacterium]|nr:polyprenyl synthetase family protein [Patescibacteria group bacterium]
MEIDKFRKIIDVIYNNELNKIYSNIKNKSIIKNNNFFQNLIKHTLKVLKGGKKIRPFLLFSVYYIFKKNRAGFKKELDSLKNILIALELFHNFCLIHDDIMDDSHYRHGIETVNYYLFNKYKKIENIKRLIKFSESEAILIGDFVFNYVFYYLNKQKWISEEIRIKFYKDFFEMVDLVVFGQILDIYLTIYKKNNFKMIEQKTLLKTSYYSFVKPLQLGYILSDDNNKSLYKKLEDIGINLGLVYQIQDDVLNIIGDKNKLGKDTLNDIINNQQTFLTYYLNRYNSEEFRKFKENIKNDLFDKDKFINFVKKSGALKFTYKKIDEYKNKIIKSLDEINNFEFSKLIENLLKIILKEK